MAFCTGCGANVPEGVKFCTGCGKSMENAAQPAPVKAVVGAQTAAQPVPASVFTQAAPGPQYAQPKNNGDTPPPKGSKYAVMSMGAYIGIMLLCSIPVLGWLICVIMAFAAGNRNRRNFAKAILVFLIIGLVLSVVLYFVFGWVSDVLVQYINEISGDYLGEAESLKDIFSMINNAGISG